MDHAIEMDRVTRKYLELAARRKLPSYERHDVPRQVVYDMSDGKEDARQNRAVTGAIVAGGLAALACMAQHYGAIDSSIVKGAMDILGSAGPAIASMPAGYAITRTI